MIKTQAKQLQLLKRYSLSYGGELLKTRKGRSHGRPLDTKSTIHVVLRSSKARGPWSFRRKDHQKKINEILDKFSKKYAVNILSVANVGNHLHLQIQLLRLGLYKPFIRAVTSSIAMAVTGVSRWTDHKGQRRDSAKAKATARVQLKFWDYRPFSRVVRGLRALLSLKDYMVINQLEGFGVRREQAQFILQGEGTRFAMAFARGPDG